MNKFSIGDVVYCNHTTLNSYKFWEVVGTEGDRVDIVGLYTNTYENKKILNFVLRTSEDSLELVTEGSVQGEANELIRLISKLYAAFGFIKGMRLKRIYDGPETDQTGSSQEH